MAGIAISAASDSLLAAGDILSFTCG